jgi:predicted transcriptional regulator
VTRGRNHKNPRAASDDSSARRMEQARLVLRLLSDLGSRCLFSALADRSNLSAPQLQTALDYLNSQGYIACRIRMDNRILYTVTFLGSDALDLLDELEMEGLDGQAA